MIFKLAAILDTIARWFQQFWISMSPQCLPPSFGSIQLTVWEEMWFENFQDGNHGSHPGYRNRIVLAILNLYVTLMPTIKFGLNPQYGLGGDVWRLSRGPPWGPSWISEQNHFSNSEYLCLPNASHQILALSDLPIGSKSCFKIFRTANRLQDKIQYQPDGTSLLV